MPSESKRHTPEAFYSCANRQCAEEICYPSSMMYWAVDEKGKGDWYCTECPSNDPGLTRQEGPSLERWLADLRKEDIKQAIDNYKER